MAVSAEERYIVDEVFHGYRPHMYRTALAVRLDLWYHHVDGRPQCIPCARTEPDARPDLNRAGEFLDEVLGRE